MPCGVYLGGRREHVSDPRKPYTHQATQKRHSLYGNGYVLERSLCGRHGRQLGEGDLRRRLSRAREADQHAVVVVLDCLHFVDPLHALSLSVSLCRDDKGAYPFLWRQERRGLCTTDRARRVDGGHGGMLLGSLVVYRGGLLGVVHVGVVRNGIRGLDVVVVHGGRFSVSVHGVLVTVRRGHSVVGVVPLRAVVGMR